MPQYHAHITANMTSDNVDYELTYEINTSSMGMFLGTLNDKIKELARETECTSLVITVVFPKHIYTGP